jgi:alpha-tubulin suppressor-like RCC1 family protein
VRTFGQNNTGQLGLGDTTSRLTPVQITGLTTAIAVAGGGYFTSVLLNDGTVRTFGGNNNGQLGVNDTTSRQTPVTVLNITSAISITGGFNFNAVLLADGTVRTFGRNNNGQLGINVTGGSRLTPVQVLNITSAIAVAGGTYQVAVLLANGTVWTFGKNDNGQLGVNDTTSRQTPVQVWGISSSAVAVACGQHLTAVLLADGTVRTFGHGAFGGLGVNDTTNRLTPVQVWGISSSAIAVSCGLYLTAVLLADGTVRTSGWNSSGQLGVNDTTDRLTPVQVLNITSAMAVSCGIKHTTVLLANGTVRTFGYNLYGQLGVNDTTSRLTPVQVLNITNASILTYPFTQFPALNLGPVAAPQYQLELSTDYARKLTTSTWSTGSDERIKTDIESANVARCVEIVQNLDLKYFQWNIQSVTDTHSLGWIAQDLEKFFPKSVETAEAHGIPDFKNVNTDQLIKVMWGALKKLRADLKSQKSSGSALSTVGDSESPAPEQNL